MGDIETEHCGLTVSMSRDREDIQGILNTLLVPMEPPNRSQWKKLELAMKFIKLSKQSVAGTKKITASEKQKIGLREQSEDKTRTRSKTERDSEERISCRQKVTLKMDPIEPSKGEVKAVLKKQKSWDKFKNCAVQIL